MRTEEDFFGDSGEATERGSETQKDKATLASGHGGGGHPRDAMHFSLNMESSAGPPEKGASSGETFPRRPPSDTTRGSSEDEEAQPDTDEAASPRSATKEATSARAASDASSEAEDDDLFEEEPEDIAGHALGKLGIYIAVLLKLGKALYMPLVMLVLLLSAIIGERVTFLKLGYLLAFFLNLLTVNLSLSVQLVTWIGICALAGSIMLITYLYQFDGIRKTFEDVLSDDFIADLGLRETSSQTALFNYVAPASFVMILSVIQERRVSFQLHSAAAEVRATRAARTEPRRPRGVERPHFTPVSPFFSPFLPFALCPRIPFFWGSPKQPLCSRASTTHSPFGSASFRVSCCF